MSHGRVDAHVPHKLERVRPALAEDAHGEGRGRQRSNNNLNAHSLLDPCESTGAIRGRLEENTR